MTTKIVILVEEGDIRAIVASEANVELIVIDLDLDGPAVNTHSAELPPCGQTIEEFIADYTPIETE